ncbi:MAG: glycosyltransferase family 2 protein [Desulfatirhabdiaceae bacterium]|nr:glycosyltransferase family 2 protein [Desulfatirhabdiaceae bacterium]
MKEFIMEISVIIVNWNTRDLLLNCIRSVYETVRDISFEIWVVDNGSTDGSQETVTSGFPQVKLIENTQNMGFAAASNRALKEMTGRYALLLNSDAALTNGAAQTLLSFMESTPTAGMACGQLLNPDGSRQNSIANFPTLLTLISNETLLRILFPDKFPSKLRNYPGPIPVESGIGACLMIRKTAMDTVGLFDENYFFFFEETDWAYRMWQANWGVYFVSSARIIHAQGKSAGNSVASRIHFYRSRYIYLKKWHPKSYSLMVIILFTRLLINACLCFLGSVLTLGLAPRLFHKTLIYFRLIAWHFKGRP